MKLSSISDLHIKFSGDVGYEKLMAFINKSVSLKCDKVLLLGDIFDLMVSNKRGYLRDFSEIFHRIEVSFLQKGVDVHFFEGNHDFNVERILNERFKYSNFYYHKEAQTFKDEEYHIYCSHGDEIDTEDLAYIKWKKIISSSIFRGTVDSLLPYELIKGIGSWMSKTSRKRGARKFDYIEVKAKVESMVLDYMDKNNLELLICGHNHILSEFDNYINNGFPQKTNKFCFYENGKLSLKDL